MRFGPKARKKGVLSEIGQRLNDPDSLVQAQATNALRRIEPEAAANAGVKSNHGSQPLLALTLTKGLETGTGPSLLQPDPVPIPKRCWCMPPAGRRF